MRFTLPGQITILHHRVRVLLVKNLQLEDTPVEGTCNTSQRIIKIDVDLSTTEKTEVFFHEILEYTLRMMNLEYDKGIDVNGYYINHRQLDMVACALKQALYGSG